MIGNKNQDKIGQDYETWLENMLQPDDTEIYTKTPCSEKSTESEQIKLKNYGQGHRVPARHKAFTAHLHFPFENRSISQCGNYMKEEDDEG